MKIALDCVSLTLTQSLQTRKPQAVTRGPGDEDYAPHQNGVAAPRKVPVVEATITPSSSPGDAMSRPPTKSGGRNMQDTTFSISGEYPACMLHGAFLVLHRSLVKVASIFETVIFYAVFSMDAQLLAWITICTNNCKIYFPIDRIGFYKKLEFPKFVIKSCCTLAWLNPLSKIIT